MSFLWLRTYLRGSRSLFGRFSSGGHGEEIFESGSISHDRSSEQVLSSLSPINVELCKNSGSGNSLFKNLGPAIANHRPRDICLPRDGESTLPDCLHMCLTNEIYGNLPVDRIRATGYISECVDYTIYIVTARNLSQGLHSTLLPWPRS